jgi:hypothetical protein
MVKALIIHKKKMQFFQNVTLWLETFKYACSDESFFWVENFVKMKTEYSTARSMFFLRKESLDFNFFENPNVMFPYWFWFYSNFLNAYISF